MDSMKVANKILKNQKFKKANMSERKSVVKSILANGHEHQSGKKVVSKVASIVANTHLSYHQRMEAMKKLLDNQTDEIKDKPINRVDEPKHAVKKAVERGRSAHKSKAQVAEDNKKAMSDGAKLAKKIAEAGKHKDLHSALQAKEHDKKAHMSGGAAVTKPSMTAKAAKALKEGEKLMHETVMHCPSTSSRVLPSAWSVCLRMCVERVSVPVLVPVPVPVPLHVPVLLLWPHLGSGEAGSRQAQAEHQAQAAHVGQGREDQEGVGEVVC